MFHLVVRQFAAFDAGASSAAFDDCDTSRGYKVLASECSQGSPCAFELVDAGYQVEDLVGDLEGV